MSTQSLFATQIFSKKLVSSKVILKSLKEESLLICKKDGAGLKWSSENYPRGFTSYGSLDQLHHFSSSFDDLRKKIDPCVAAFSKSLGFKIKKNELQMTRMWVNIMGEGCTHAAHIHPLSVVSGTFYVDTPVGTSSIKFEDPRIQSFMARPPAAIPYYNFKPKSGDVVLFESWLKHEVPPIPSNKKRISVSFNYDWV